MAVGPGGVKHRCYLISARLGQRLRCREVCQQCAGGGASGRIAKEGLELRKRGRGDLLELVAAAGDLPASTISLLSVMPSLCKWRTTSYRTWSQTTPAVLVLRKNG